jgi:transcriptional regulator NrdR family protein
MKCPECKAWTSVKETRKRSDGSTYRRYECANLHRFNTREFVVPSRKTEQ